MEPFLSEYHSPPSPPTPTPPAVTSRLLSNVPLLASHSHSISSLRSREPTQPRRSSASRRSCRSRPPPPSPRRSKPTQTQAGCVSQHHTSGSCQVNWDRRPPRPDRTATVRVWTLKPWESCQFSAPVNRLSAVQSKGLTATDTLYYY